MFDISPESYSTIFYAIVVFFSLLVFSQYETFTNDRYLEAPEQSSWGVMLFTLFFVLFIGLRPVSAEAFVDMATYEATYNVIKGNDFIFSTDEDTNLIYDNLFRWMASKELPSTYFFLIIAAIYFIGISWACSLFFPKDKMASILVYLSAFSTFAYGTNGIKAGAAASAFLVALACYERRRWIWVIIFMFMSYGIHHAMVLPIIAFAVCLFIKNPRVMLSFWIIAFFISLLHITAFQKFFAGFITEHGADYLLGVGGYVKSDFFGGFRIDFILYSVVPIVVGQIAIEKKKIESANYVFLLNLYTLINAAWLLCMYSDFTNRIAYLSWMLFPIVLIYPFLNEEWEGPKYKIFQWVAYLHLAFNLVMEYIYW